MTELEPFLIIYHANCCDGFTAAWAAQRLLDGPCELFAATYAGDADDVELPDVTGRRVYMLDFCVGAEQLRRLIEAAEDIHVIDHHASAERVCGEFGCCTFDLERSGAGLTWDILSGRSERPWLIAYVEDRDLWRHALPDTREINAFIALVPKTVEEWDLLLAEGAESVAALGEVAIGARDAYVEAMLPLARRMSFAGHADIPMVNAPPPHISDLVGRLAKDAPFAVGWHQRGDGRYVYSLRSHGGFDVGALAQEHGGGGHPGAAGFTRSTPFHIESEQQAAADTLTITNACVDEDTIRRRLDTIGEQVRVGIWEVDGEERVEILVPTLSAWRVGGSPFTEPDIANALTEALEADPGPASSYRQIDEGDLRRDRLRAFVGKFSIWEIDGEVIAKRGHDFEHADPGVALQLVAEPGLAAMKRLLVQARHIAVEIVALARDGEHADGDLESLKSAAESYGWVGLYDEDGPTRLEAARDFFSEVCGGRPDFDGFASALDGEAAWTESLHRSGSGADQAQAGSDAAGIRRLAETVRSVGRGRGYM